MVRKTLKQILENSKKEGECIEFLGNINNRGYGRLWYKGKHHLAHRSSYEFYKGKITDGKFICHTCDNRKCINPDHLYEGSFRENSQDRYKNYTRKTKKLNENLSYLSVIIPREIHDMIIVDSFHFEMKIREYVTQILKIHFHMI